MKPKWGYKYDHERQTYSHNGREVKIIQGITGYECDIGILLATAVLHPEAAQEVYVEFLRIIGGLK